MSILTIIEKLLKLKSIPTEEGNLLEVFNASRHKFKFNAPLSEEELRAYEKQYDLTIPKAYREFLITIGDGGMGPFYGLLPLRDNEDCTDDDALSNEFRLTRDTPINILEAYNKQTERAAALREAGKDDEIEASWAEYRAAEEALLEKADAMKYLCTEGCGMYSVLIMKGEEAGNVWYHDFANDCGLFALVNLETGKSLDFFDWYNVWLDSLLEDFDGEEHKCEDCNDCGECDDEDYMFSGGLDGYIDFIWLPEDSAQS